MDLTLLLFQLLSNASFLLALAELTHSNEQTTESHIFGVERYERSARLDTSPCSSRCDRLVERSLQRIGYTSHKIETSLRTKLIVHKLDDICWKFLDYEDCASQCPLSETKNDRLSDLLRVVKKRCKAINQGYDEHFQCIHKYHTFLEVRCSSYSKEASARRAASLTTHGKPPRRTVKAELQETCRFLHYHNLCLANTVFYYCPNAKELYNRFTLRDYFLSFIVPSNDRDFSDELLDYCEVFDFQKMAKEIYEKTNPTTPKQATSVVNTVTFPDDGLYEIRVTPPKVAAAMLADTSTKSEGPNRTKKPKRVFSSEEDLEDTPPNFFYSSARVTPSMQYDTKTASKSTHHYDRDHRPVGQNHDEIEFVTHPVTDPVSLDFSFEADDYSSYSPLPTDSVNEYSTEDDYSPHPRLAISSQDASTESAVTVGSEERTPSLGEEVKLDYAEDYDEYGRSYEEESQETTEVAKISKFGSFETTRPMQLPEEIRTTVSTEPWTRTGTYEEDDFAVTNRLPDSTEAPPKSSVDKPLLVGTKVHIKKIRQYGEPGEDEEEENEIEIGEHDEYYPAEQDDNAEEEELPQTVTTLPKWFARWPTVSISATSHPPRDTAETASDEDDDTTDEVTSEPVGPTSTVIVLLGIYTVFFLVIIFVLTLLVLCMLVRSKRQKHLVKVPLYYCERY